MCLYEEWVFWIERVIGVGDGLVYVVLDTLAFLWIVERVYSFVFSWTGEGGFGRVVRGGEGKREGVEGGIWAPSRGKLE